MDSNKAEAVSKRPQAYILIKQGYSVRDTVQLIGNQVFFVKKWSIRDENGTFERKKGGGIPSKISSKILTTLEKSKYKRHQSKRKLSRKLKHSGLTVCKSSVHNYLKKNLGIKAYKRKHQSLLTEKQRKNRLLFAKKYQDLSEKEWEDYVFSDESPMYLVYQQNIKNDIVWESHEWLKRTRMQISDGQCQQVDFQQTILYCRDKRLTQSIMLKTFWRRKLSPC